MHRGVRLKKVTTKRTQISSSVAASTLAQAFKVYLQFYTDLILIFAILVLTSLSFCLSTPAHRQGPKAKVPIPLSPASRREKVPRVPEHKQSAREWQLPLLLRYLQFRWNLLLLLQKHRLSKYHLLLNRKKRHKQKILIQRSLNQKYLSQKTYRLMCMNKLPIQQHRWSLPSRQVLLFLKVTYFHEITADELIFSVLQLSLLFLQLT